MNHLQSEDYFRRRAEEEREAAEHAGDERAAHSHRELSVQYERLANGEALPPGHSDQQDSRIIAKEFRIVP